MTEDLFCEECGGLTVCYHEKPCSGIKSTGITFATDEPDLCDECFIIKRQDGTYNRPVLIN